MKQSSINFLLVGFFSILSLSLAAILFNVQAQSEETMQPVEPALSAAAGPLFNYQGELRNAVGNPITNASIPMTFRLYPTTTGGSACWTENRSVNVQNGQFNVVLGQVTAIPSSCVTGTTYLELVINGETLTPREVLTSVASAVVASTLSSGAQLQGPLSVNGNLLATGEVSAYDLKAMNLNIGGGTAFHTNGIDRILHLLPWAGSGQAFDRVCVGCGFGNPGLIVSGNLDLRGNCLRTGLDRGESGGEDSSVCKSGNVISGAYIEANLMSDEDRANEKVERFESGDLLCWSGETNRLEKCSIPNDPLVMAVADASGRPVVLGAEEIKVIGRVDVGDYLVSSSIPGYAMASAEPSFGIVIGQALEVNDHDMGLIKAMIRKM